MERQYNGLTMDELAVELERIRRGLERNISELEMLQDQVNTLNDFATEQLHVLDLRKNQE